MKKVICLIFVILFSTAILANANKIICSDNSFTILQMNKNSIWGRNPVGLVELKTKNLWTVISPTDLDSCSYNDTLYHDFLISGSHGLATMEDMDGVVTTNYLKYFKCFCKINSYLLAGCYYETNNFTKITCVDGSLK
jgi:hypothetical protein